MTTKIDIKVDKENKVLTLKVTVPKKKYAREENVTFLGKHAWEAVKNYKVPGYEVVEKKQSLIVDNWRLNNIKGSYEFELKKLPQAKKVLKTASSKKQEAKPTKLSRSTVPKKSKG